MRKLLTLLLLGLSCVAFAQNRQTVTGKVTAGNEPLVGAFVTEKGTSNGASTDLDGNYTIKVAKGAVLEFSCIGYKVQDVTVGESAVINVKMEEDVSFLDEVVVIGYGVQKKSVVTASISHLNSETIKNTASTRIDNVLKGVTSGVTVTSSSGQPGASSQVRIRGVGTINNSEPLYIVDGMAIDGGIDYLNPNDIQSVEVLKDAASGAVYGARAANGVILVTTKSGVKGNAKVSYDFQYGVQNPWKKYDVLNGTEYALMINEGLLNQGQAARYADPYSYGKGTDWQQAIFNWNAPEQSHQLTISGANDRVNYFISGGYFNQQGTIGGNFGRSNYSRITLRSNTTYKLFDTKERSFLNQMIIGINIAYSHTNSTGITTNSEFGGPLGSALAMSPLQSIYADDSDALLAEHPSARVDPRNGKAYSIVDGGIYNEMANPLAQLSMPADQWWSDKFVTNFWGEVNLMDHLKFKSSFGGDMSFWGDTSWSPAYYYSSKLYRDYSNASMGQYRAFTWQIENTLTYQNTFCEKLNVEAMFGQSAKSNEGLSVGGSNKYLVEENAYKAGLWFTTGTQTAGDMSVWGGTYSPHRLSSLFARFSANWDERYMFQATVRRDGSSNFGPANLYAIFPSASFGWNFANESFIKENASWLASGKLRLSWGKNGNEAIGQYGYTTTIATGNNYAFGNPGVIATGAKPNGFSNENLKWEESTQTDVGVDFGFLNNALTFSVDWYKKITSGMLMSMPIPAYAGDSAPTGNVGKMSNSGVEMEMNYRFNFGDVNFNFGANATYLKNVLIELGNENGWANYDTHKIGTLTRGQNGYPFPYFYGWKTDGIFQNWSEVNAYTNSDGTLIQPKAQPGDVRFVDVDKNGSITDEDRTYLGKGMPDWTYGFNFGGSFKGLDWNFLFQGVAGVQVVNVTRRTDLYYINLPSYMLGCWEGEGTSNRLPRFSMGSDNNENWRMSDLWVEDGAYFRLKNAQIGYTLPERWTKKILISSLRLYVSGENLFTATKYSGFDPEVSSGGTSLGIDRGVYPQSRVYSIGLNLKF